MRVRAPTSGGHSPILEVNSDESSSDREDTIVAVATETFNRVGTPQGRLFCIGSCVVITGTIMVGLGLWLTKWIASYNNDC